MHLQGQLTAHLYHISRSSDVLREQLKTAGGQLYPAREGAGAFETAQKLTDEIRVLEGSLRTLPMYPPTANNESPSN